jgi:hypothetical protein
MMERVLANINRNNRNILFPELLSRKQKLTVAVDVLLVE